MLCTFVERETGNRLIHPIKGKNRISKRGKVVRRRKTHSHTGSNEPHLLWLSCRLASSEPRGQGEMFCPSATCSHKDRKLSCLWTSQRTLCLPGSEAQEAARVLAAAVCVSVSGHLTYAVCTPFPSLRSLAINSNTLPFCWAQDEALTGTWDRIFGSQ